MGCHSTDTLKIQSVNTHLFPNTSGFFVPSVTFFLIKIAPIYLLATLFGNLFTFLQPFFCNLKGIFDVLQPFFATYLPFCNHFFATTRKFCNHFFATTRNFCNHFWQPIYLLAPFLATKRERLILWKKEPNKVIVAKTTTPNGKRDNRKAVTLRFNAEEWEEIKIGIKWLYFDNMIPKPTAYSYLKWCGLIFSESLENKHIGNN